MNQMLSRSLRTAMLTGVMLSTTQGSALAQSVPSIELGSTASLDAHALITVPVTFTCPEDTVLSNILVDVTQAYGPNIAHGSGGRFDTPSQPDPELICDGTPHTVNVGVVLSLDSSGSFHGGSIVASASITACPPSFDCLTGTDGPTVLRIH